jgi:hypothetical protein
MPPVLQVKDVNISLTSVEMLWKVADFTITSASSPHSVLILQLGNTIISDDSYIALILDLMLKQLFQLSMDSRPLIRHCAMNTLFSGM